MLEVLQGSAFTTPAILVRTFDGHTAATGVVSGDVTIEYRKPGETELTGYTFAASAWTELGRGLYDVDWTTSHSDTLGDFIFAVLVSGSVPYYGQAGVVVARTDEVWAQVSGRTHEEVYNAVTGIDLDPVYSQVSGRTTVEIFNAVTGIDLDPIYSQVSGRTTVEIFNAVTGIPVVDLDPIYSQVSGRTTTEIFNAVTGIDLDPIYSQVSGRSHEEIYNAVTGVAGATNLPVVQVGASYNGVTLGISIGLEREGQAVTNPISGVYVLYGQTGGFVASGSSSSADAQGVFRFTITGQSVLSGAMFDDSVPYVHARVKDSEGFSATRQYLPVVG